MAKEHLTAAGEVFPKVLTLGPGGQATHGLALHLLLYSRITHHRPQFPSEGWRPVAGLAGGLKPAPRGAGDSAWIASGQTGVELRMKESHRARFGDPSCSRVM